MKTHIQDVRKEEKYGFSREKERERAEEACIRHLFFLLRRGGLHLQPRYWYIRDISRYTDILIIRYISILVYQAKNVSASSVHDHRFKFHFSPDINYFFFSHFAIVLRSLIGDVVLDSRRPFHAKPVDRLLHVDREPSRSAALHIPPQRGLRIRPGRLRSTVQSPHVC